MDIALTFDRLVPGGDWQGSVTANTRESFDAVRWNDARTKPTWAEVVDKWAEIVAEPSPPPPRNIEREMDDLKARITQLEKQPRG